MIVALVVVLVVMEMIVAVNEGCWTDLGDDCGSCSGDGCMTVICVVLLLNVHPEGIMVKVCVVSIGMYGDGCCGNFVDDFCVVYDCDVEYCMIFQM